MGETTSAFLFPGQPLLKSLYEVSDGLWVKERFAYEVNGFGNSTGKIFYAEQEDNKLPIGHAWLPSQLMRKEDSRITLEITDIRVERLQEISEGDCSREGIKTVKMNCRTCNGSGWTYTYPPPAGCPNCKKTGIHNKPYFIELWNSLAKKGFKWESNCWVWVISFKKVKK